RKNLLMGIVRNASKERDAIAPAIEKIEKYIEMYKPTDNMEGLISMFKENSLDFLLFAFGGGKGATAELSRATTLLGDDRILYIDRYMEDRSEGRWTFPVPPNNDTLKGLVMDWSDRLRETKSKDQPHNLFTDDAKVMARLEWMNREMAIASPIRNCTLALPDSVSYIFLTSSIKSYLSPTKECRG
ncbi:hypothetical protein MBAV_000454, partial [Candidatus Magnetobacterium bavaricum]